MSGFGAPFFGLHRASVEPAGLLQYSVGQVEEVPHLVREYFVLLLVEQIALGFDPDELCIVAAAGGPAADVMVDECGHDVIVGLLGEAVLGRERISDEQSRNPGQKNTLGPQVHTVQHVEMEVVAARRHTRLREEVVEHRGREAAELAQRTLPPNRYGSDLEQAGAGILVEEHLSPSLSTLSHCSSSMNPSQSSSTPFGTSVGSENQNPTSG